MTIPSKPLPPRVLVLVLVLVLVACGASQSGSPDGSDAPPPGVSTASPNPGKGDEPPKRAQPDREEERPAQTKAAECNTLIRVANREQEVMSRAAGTIVSANDPSSIENLGDVLQDSGNRIGAVRLQDPNLRLIQRAYRAMLLRAAQDCRTLSHALQTNDAAAARSARDSLSKVGGDEATIVNAISSYCRG